MERPDPTSRPAPDLAARFLEVGLCVTVIVAPLPFGAVGAGGRLLLESLALALGIVWLARSVLRYTPLPSRTMTIGVVGLLALAALQALPLGDALVAAVSPRAVELREASAAGDVAALAAELSILGIDPGTAPATGSTASLSLDPSATASALRNGIAMAALFLVAACVAATRGVRQLSLCLLISGSFQGLYGLLILASGHDMIWNQPKLHYLNAATGTFVNKNHFAVFVGMTLACGLALILDDARRNPSEGGRRRWVELLGGTGSRQLAWALLLVLGLAGVLLSLSRAGIVLVLMALGTVWLVTGSRRVLRTRVIVAVVVLIVALTPLVQLGTDRLVERYSQSAFDMTKSNSRSVVWGDTLDMVAAFPLAGTGFGTFATAYPAFRSPEVRLFYAHAHNDPLQVVAEGGLPGAVLLLLVLIPVGALCLRALGGAKGTFGVGFAAGLMVLLLHTIIDFDFRIPANAMVAAILAGALFGMPWKDPR